MGQQNSKVSNKGNLKEVASLFFKLGCIAFGGPAAHIAMLEDEVVEKRKWMSRDHFLDLIGLTNLIPGPNSTEMTMHCGYERAGWKGLFVAGLCFIFPAVVLTGALAWLYVEFGDLPNIKPFIYGIKPAVIGIIVSALYKLGKKAVKGWELGIIGVITLSMCLLGLNEISALLISGVVGTLYFYLTKGIDSDKSQEKKSKSKSAFWSLLAIPGTAAASAMPIKIFLIFFKVGAILYGSGYVLIAYLDAELVEKGLLTAEQLMDAIAVGQFTPGPVLSTATFVGFQMGGPSGAIMASIGIFLPSFLFVLILKPIIPRIRKSKILSYFLNSVNVAAVAVMASVLITLGAEFTQDWRAIIIAVLSIAAVLLIKKVSPIWLVLGGSLLGFLLVLIP